MDKVIELFDWSRANLVLLTYNRDNDTKSLIFIIRISITQ